ncbi:MULTISPECIES: hypothetical protein [Cupriavidus]|uniref:Uncharacterized protein n=1 Tax=Cupriavidus taiwanensis TaxID=164546 RepID=A0A976ARZ1_9BURK|nr:MULTISPECIES: hypothetical protein [Cupriavidus]MEC3768974.1 hypothetical protein [Cupriavidus sp. SS-3]SOZ00958.1 conserved hypothetical protein [Cupriavidus taiwanensis]SOZ06695.1 conserved hypothetical protein [Cupriavidus taiwanensis]SPD67831.1 conserved protein of unknown function [Cupriavidus taiwanensis]
MNAVTSIDPSLASLLRAVRQAPQPGSHRVIRAGRQKTPTEVLTDNSNDRPDVATIAVLGYN